LWAETAGLEGPAELPSADVEARLKEMAANYTTEEVHSGSRSLRVGIVDASKNVAGYSEARQRVTISWNCKTCLVRFWLYPTGGTIDNKDIQIVSLLDNNLKQKERLLTMRSNSGKREYYEFDLTKYRGQTVWLYFGVYNDGKGSVLVCMWMMSLCLVQQPIFLLCRLQRLHRRLLHQRLDPCQQTHHPRQEPTPYRGG
jgi:hypothetical protein